ncbi:hypothetical protein [Luteolibacter marinus]|uniref:hypothetical protein n=1 Tax=Luteolibacter marinus TaxID=2776705 RepID=UPI00186810ED|nr:hypothetical protein [Luteolibacter marinus]
MGFFPELLLEEELSDDRLGQRVGEAPGDEKPRLALLPMGQVAPVFLDGLVGIEEHTEKDFSSPWFEMKELETPSP